MASALQEIIKSGSIEDKARFIIANNVNYMQGKKVYKQASINRIYFSCQSDKERLLLDKYIDFSLIVSNFRFQLYSLQRNIKCNSLVLDNLFEKWVFCLDMLRTLQNVDPKFKKEVFSTIKNSPGFEGFFNINSDGILLLTDVIKNQDNDFLGIVGDLKKSILSDMAIAKGWILAIETAATEKGCNNMIPSDIQEIINNIKKQGAGNKLMNSSKEKAFFNMYENFSEDRELFRAFCVFPCYESITANSGCFADAMVYFKNLK